MYCCTASLASSRSTLAASRLAAFWLCWISNISLAVVTSASAVCSASCASSIFWRMREESSTTSTSPFLTLAPGRRVVDRVGMGRDRDDCHVRFQRDHRLAAPRSFPPEAPVGCRHRTPVILSAVLTLLPSDGCVHVREIDCSAGFRPYPRA